MLLSLQSKHNPSLRLDLDSETYWAMYPNLVWLTETNNSFQWHPRPVDYELVSADAYNDAREFVTQLKIIVSDAKWMLLYYIPINMWNEIDSVKGIPFFSINGHNTAEEIVNKLAVPFFCDLLKQKWNVMIVFLLERMKNPEEMVVYSPNRLVPPMHA